MAATFLLRYSTGLFNRLCRSGRMQIISLSPANYTTLLLLRALLIERVNIITYILYLIREDSGMKVVCGCILSPSAASS